MKPRRWLAIALAAALTPLAVIPASAAWSLQSGGTQAQQPAPPPQSEKKKAKKVWTDEDFAQRPAAAPSAPTPAAEAAPRAPSGQQPARPSEAEVGVAPEQEPETVESLEQELQRLATDRESYLRQIEDFRARMRDEPNERRWAQQRDDMRALEDILRQNEEETAAVQARLEQARKRKPPKSTKPATRAPAQQPAPPTPPGWN